MAYCGKIDLQFTKTYATAANADKAVKAFFDKLPGDKRIASYFIVPVVTKDPEVFANAIRYGVMLCGLGDDGLRLQIAMASGFNLVN